MELCNVPKMIPMLRRRWAPEAFVVSFKVSTHEETAAGGVSQSFRDVWEDFVGKCSLMHRARPALEACCGLLQGWYISETIGKRVGTVLAFKLGT
jgi:hypothetical protein